MSAEPSATPNDALKAALAELNTLIPRRVYPLRMHNSSVCVLVSGEVKYVRLDGDGNYPAITAALGDEVESRGWGWSSATQEGGWQDNRKLAVVTTCETNQHAGTHRAHGDTLTTALATALLSALRSQERSAYPESPLDIVGDQ